jgi:hypothetical protein
MSNQAENCQSEGQLVCALCRFDLVASGLGRQQVERICQVVRRAIVNSANRQAIAAERCRIEQNTDQCDNGCRRYWSAPPMRAI